MPKIRPLIVDAKKDRDDFRQRLIKSKAAFRGYKTQKELAQALCVSENWLCRRLNGISAFELDDMVKLDHILRFSADEMAQIVRGK